MEISLAAWMAQSPIAVAAVGVLQHGAKVGLERRHLAQRWRQLNRGLKLMTIRS